MFVMGPKAFEFWQRYEVGLGTGMFVMGPKGALFKSFYWISFRISMFVAGSKKWYILISFWSLSVYLWVWKMNSKDRFKFKK